MADAQIDILKTSIDWAKAEIFFLQLFCFNGIAVYSDKYWILAAG